MELDKFSGALPLCEIPNHRTMECGMICLSKHCTVQPKPLCPMCLYDDHIQHLKDCIPIPKLADQLAILKTDIDSNRLKKIREKLPDDCNLNFEARWKQFEGEVHILFKECHDQLHNAISNSETSTKLLKNILEDIGKYLVLEPDSLLEDKKFENFVAEMRLLLTNDSNKISLNSTYLEQRAEVIIQTHASHMDSYSKAIENLSKQIAELSKPYNRPNTCRSTSVERVERFIDKSIWIVKTETPDIIIFTSKLDSFFIGFGQFYGLDNSIPAEMEIMEGELYLGSIFICRKSLENFKYEIQKLPAGSTTRSYDFFFSNPIKLSKNISYIVKIQYQKNGEYICGQMGKFTQPKHVIFQDLGPSDTIRHMPYLIFGE